MSLGATKSDWQHFDLVLGLGADLLPVVPDPNATPSINSKVKKFGKIPSAYDREGGAHGLKDWQKREITEADIARWSSDERLGLCVRSSAVRAIDVDITDPAQAAEIMEFIYGNVPAWLPRRERADSSKFLCAFTLEGKHAKRVIKTAHGIIEFLADGQQFLVAGTHPSGARYEWNGGLPDEIPALQFSELDALWNALEAKFGVEIVTKPTQAPASAEGLSPGVLTEIEPAVLDDLKSALSHPALLAWADNNSNWSEIGYALLSLAGTGQELFHAFSVAAPGFDEEACFTWWAAHISQEPRSDYRHIFTLARRLGWRTVASLDQFPIGDVADLVGDLIPDKPAKPILRLTSGQLDRYALQAEHIMSPEVFVQTGSLVRIGDGSEVQDTTLNRSPEQRSILRVTAEYMRRKLNQMAEIEKYSKTEKAWVPIDCPVALAINIIDQKEWPHLRQLEAISRSPFLRMDGSVCETEGYDVSSGVMYLPNAAFPSVPNNPTKEQAAASLAELLAPFEEFPYATEASKTAFVAHILTEVTRVAVSSAPMFWYSAPSAGTGKTLLSKMPGMIVHGEETTLRPWVDDNEEIRKVIFASLLAGDRSIGFDNVPNGTKIRSPLLCALLTSGGTYKDRKLGASEVIAVKNKATCFASGNNITPVSDMSRRSLIIRLDADVGSKQLRNRQFIIRDLESHVKNQRPELFAHALTIVRAYVCEPQKLDLPQLPSFERWSTFVREPLIWLGMVDPVDTQEDETDDEVDAVAFAFETLAPKLAGQFVPKDILAATDAFDGSTEIYDALTAAGCSDASSAIKISYWLRDKRDVIAGGYKLEKGTTLHGVQRWMFRNMGAHEDLL